MLLSQDRVAIARECQWTLHVEVVVRKLFASVLGSRERDVGVLLDDLLALAEEHAHDGGAHQRHQRHDDNYPSVAPSGGSFVIHDNVRGFSGVCNMAYEIIWPVKYNEILFYVKQDVCHHSLIRMFVNLD